MTSSRLLRQKAFLMGCQIPAGVLGKPLSLGVVHRDHEPLAARAGVKAPINRINRTHSKRFAPTESADHAPASGVRAPSAPLCPGRAALDCPAGASRAPFVFSNALGP